MFLIMRVAAAQVVVSGKVVTESQEPAVATMVHLFSAPQDSLVRYAMVDEAGKYAFIAVPVGEYLIRLQRIGMQPEERRFAVGPGSNEVVLADFILKYTSNSLTEVAVTVDKRVLEYRSDKTVVHVEGTPLSQEENVVKALEGLPGMEVASGTNHISVLGKSNVAIYVNGRPSKMSLASLPASAVSTIEIITNADARFDAKSDAIINVNLNKWDQQGVSGEVKTTYTKGRYDYKYVSSSLAYNKGCFSSNSQFYIANNKFFLDRDTRDTFFGWDPVLIKQSQERRVIRQKYYYLYSDINYTIDSLSLVGLNVEYGKSWDPYRNVFQDDYFSVASERPVPADSVYENTAQLVHGLQELTLGSFYTHDLKEKKGSFRLESNYYYNALTSTYDYSFSAGKTKGQPSDIFLLNKADENNAVIWSSLLDFNYALPGRQTLQAGFKHSYLLTNFSSDFAGAERFVDLHTIDYRSRENIYAGYAQYKKTGERLSFDAGLRYEYTSGGGRYLAEEKRTAATYRYGDFFPSASVNYRHGEDHFLKLSYSRRINRPTFYDRSPFSYYISPFTRYEGNVALRRQYSHAHNLEYILKEKYALVLFANKVQDNIATLTFLEGPVSVIRPVNYDMRSYGGSTSVPVRFNSWWRGRHKVTLSSYKTSGTFQGQAFSTDILRFQAYAKHYMNIKNLFELSLTGWYSTPYNIGVAKVEMAPSMDAALSKSLWNDKIDLSLIFTDVFNSEQKTVTTNFHEQTSLSVRNDDTHRLAVSITYNFIRGRKNENKTSNIINQEKSRIGGE
ncbi:outer membrane beta-barrel family protein [Pontibacter korlensis]|nr:outer membrane beta-barrel family protein [Pontibacter korlensis]